MSEGEKEARTHMVEIWEGEEIWGDFYAKLLYEGKREGKEAASPVRQKNQLPEAALHCPRSRVSTD